MKNMTNLRYKLSHGQSERIVLLCESCVARAQEIQGDMFCGLTFNFAGETADEWYCECCYKSILDVANWAEEEL